MSTLGDIATVAAPTVVALAAIGASVLQQSRSRSFDRSERQKDRRHDRAMRDLDYQRALMDDAAIALDRINRELANVVTHVYVHGTPPPHEVMEAAGVASTALKLVISRLGLRLGAEHEIVMIMREAHAAMLVVAVQGLFDPNDRARVQQVRSDLNDAHRRITRAIDHFVIAVSRHTGALPRFEEGLNTCPPGSTSLV